MNTDLLQLPISNIMTTDVITLEPKDLMEDAKRIFNSNNIHHIPVINLENKVIGIISIQDFNKVLHGFTLFKTQKSSEYNEAILRAFLVEDVMTKYVVTLEESEPISKALDIFKENLFHAIPIIKTDGTLSGIVTTFDLLNIAFQRPKGIE